MNKSNLKLQAKTVFGMTKLNFKLSKTAYLITLLMCAVMCANYITAFFTNSEDNEILGIGNFLFLLPLLMAVFIPTLHFSKFLNLGTKRLDFFKSCIFTYIPAVVVMTALSIIPRFTIDKLILKRIQGIFDLFDVFGFTGFAGYFQMLALVLFATCLTHTVTLIQGKWYGYLADLFLLFWIILFPSIPVFRPIVRWFYKTIIFNKYALLQILSCLLLSTAIYALSLFPIKNKKI